MCFHYYNIWYNSIPLEWKFKQIYQIYFIDKHKYLQVINFVKCFTIVCWSKMDKKVFYKQVSKCLSFCYYKHAESLVFRIAKCNWYKLKKQFIQIVIFIIWFNNGQCKFGCKLIFFYNRKYDILISINL